MFKFERNSYNFLEKFNLTWNELVWANKNNIIDLNFIEYYLDRKLDRGQGTDTEVSVYLDLEDKNISSVLDNFENTYIQLVLEVKEHVKNKWLYIIIKYLYVFKEKFDDCYEVIEEVYADFDYPSSIESFIRYMPTKDIVITNDSVEGVPKLQKNWENYLLEYEEEHSGIYF